MGHDTVTVTENDRESARTAVMNQVEWHKVDLSVPANAAFVEQMIQNSAAHMAWDRLFQNIFHSVYFDGAANWLKEQRHLAWLEEQRRPDAIQILAGENNAKG